MTLHHFEQVVVLHAIDNLLYHHGSAHLGIVHIAEEDFGTVLSVNHERRKHLHLLTKECATRAIGRKSTYGLAINDRVLAHP